MIEKFTIDKNSSTKDIQFYDILEHQAKFQKDLMIILAKFISSMEESGTTELFSYLTNSMHIIMRLFSQFVEEVYTAEKKDIEPILKDAFEAALATLRKFRKEDM